MSQLQLYCLEVYIQILNEDLRWAKGDFPGKRYAHRLKKRAQTTKLKKGKYYLYVRQSPFISTVKCAKFPSELRGTDGGRMEGIRHNNY